METQTVGSKIDKLFNLIYLAEEHSKIEGKRVVDKRIELGKKLANKFIFSADCVIPIPETAIPYAMGYAKEANMPFSYAVYKKRPKQKTLFISDREKTLKDIFFVVPEFIKGKRIILVDEAVISGLSLKYVLKLIKKCKPKSIHVRVVNNRLKKENLAKYFGVTSFGWLDEKEIK